MKRISSLFIILGLISFSSRYSHAQNREVGANSLALDNGAGVIVDIKLPAGMAGGPYNWTLPISSGGASSAFVLPGASAGQTLYWNSTNSNWANTSVFTNDGVSQLGFTGQLTGSSATATYTTSIANTNATAYSALQVNQGGNTLPNSALGYTKAAIIAAGDKFGIIATASAAGGGASGAGVYGATDNLSGNNIMYANGAGVEGVSFGSQAGVVGINNAGTGNAIYGISSFSTGNAGQFDGQVLVNGNLVLSPGVLSPQTTLSSTASAARAISFPDRSGTVGLSGATYQAQPTNPVGTSSTGYVQMGLGSAATITPSGSGKVLIIISGTILNNTAGQEAYVGMDYGTSPAPGNGVAIPGSAITIGNQVEFLEPATAIWVPFSVNAIVTGLTAGTTYWLDLILAAPTGGVAGVSQLSISAMELP